MRDLLNRLANLVTPRLLRSPLHFLMSRSVMLVTFAGRSSGKVYTTPVEYMQDGNTLSFFTQRNRVWWKNLRDGADVTVRVRGHELHGQADAITDEAAILTGFKRMHEHMTASKDFAAKMVLVEIVLDERTKP